MMTYDGGASLIASTESDNPFVDDHFDFRQTLVNCRGLYECPTDDYGRPQGPLVGYAGKYDDDGVMRNYVGLAYYNFSMADQHPAVLRRVAFELAKQFRVGEHEADVILGAPMAGIKLSAVVAEELGCCRHIFAEKEVLALGVNGSRAEEKLALKRYDILPGERVWVGEALINNLSTALKLVNLIKNAGGRFAGIIAAINRSEEDVRTFYGMPIVSLLHAPTPQYRQDDPLVLDAIERGYEIIWKPTTSWAALKSAMGR